MAIMYIDESWDRNDKYLVLSGLIVPFFVWNKLDDNIRKMKEEFFGSDEFNLKDIRRKKYDKSKVWEKLPEPKKREFNARFYRFIQSMPIAIMSVLIEKDKLGTNDNKSEFFRLAYSFLIQRYQYHLQENDAFGIVVMDKSGNKEIKDLFHHHRKLKREGVPYKVKEIESDDFDITSIPVKGYEKHNIDNIIKNLIFIDDNYSNCLQIVDMICAAVSGKYNRNTDIYFKRIESKFRRRAEDGEVMGYGLKFFPKAPVNLNNDSKANP